MTLSSLFVSYFSFSLHEPAPSSICSLSLHDALPIFDQPFDDVSLPLWHAQAIKREDFCPLVDDAHHYLLAPHDRRSEEHTSELQSPCNLVCRLLLEKKKNIQIQTQLPKCLHRHILFR